VLVFGKKVRLWVLVGNEREVMVLVYWCIEITYITVKHIYRNITIIAFY
jgi:hypothetical protein